VIIPSPPSRDFLRPASTGLPPRAGAGFKPQHFGEWLGDPDAPAFIEVHAENYMGAGGAPHAWLTRMREHRALSIHGVGLSIGSAAQLDKVHLERLARLIERYQPEAFSEHLAWSTHNGRFLNDLLPLVYDTRTLDRVCAHIDQVQDRLRRRMLLENPSTYFEFEASDMAEPEFIARVVKRTGCGLLLDVNNVYVSCRNNGRDPVAYLDAIPLFNVDEIHLAGHAEELGCEDRPLLIDNHGGPVAAPVWDLYAHAISITGPVATLIEWDSDVPAYATLVTEVRRADLMLDAARSVAMERAA